MPATKPRSTATVAIWSMVAVLTIAPLILAAESPLLQWREPVYILAGFAGIVALDLLLLQPLLMVGILPGLAGRRGRHFHYWVGCGLAAAVIIHVAALWRTSPPDVMDALLFRSPTAFSYWGVNAMWAVFCSTLLAVFRNSWRWPPRAWRMVHLAVGFLIVAGSILHAFLIEGTMEPLSKAALCLAVGLAMINALLRTFRGRRRPS